MICAPTLIYQISYDMHSLIQMQLSIKVLTGQTFAIEAKPTDTISAIKSKISTHQDGVPTHKQLLIFAGTQLVNHKSLTNYNIQDGATIHLVGMRYLFVAI